MADENLEQRLKESKSMEDQDNLESRVNEAPEKRKGFLETLKEFSWWDWTKIIASNVVGAVFGGGLFGFGAINVLATTVSFVAANYLVNRKKGFDKNELQTEFVLGGIYTPVLSQFFKYVNLFTPNPLAWMNAYALALYPLTIATHAMKHIIKKYTPSTFIHGVFKGEPFKDISYIAKDAVTESIKSSFLSALFLTLPVAGVHYLLPDKYLIASLFPIRTTYRYILESQAIKKGAKKNTSYNEQKGNVVKPNFAPEHAQRRAA